MDRSEFFAATHQGRTGCTWHIFKKNEGYNSEEESLCRKLTSDALKAKSTRKSLENLDLDSPLASAATARNA